MATTVLNAACPWVKCVSDATYPRWQLVSFEYLDADHSGGDVNVYIWTKDAAGNFRSNVAVMQHNGGDTKLLTKSEPGKVGEVDFAQSGASSFDPNDGKVGPYSVDIKDAIPSDRVTGMGLPLSRHVVYKLTFQIVETAPQPEGEVEIKSVLLEPTTLTPNGQYGVLLRVTMTIYNGTSQPLETQGPEPGYCYKEGETFQTIGKPEVKGTFRVGLDYEGRTGIDHPYRWGLGSALAPGETRTIDGFVEEHNPTPEGGVKHWAGLVCEQERWIQDHIGEITVTVTESPRYSLTVQTTGQGSVTVSPEQADYAPGSQVTLSATPADDWKFAGWGGSILDNPLIVTMAKDLTLTAVFEQITPLPDDDIAAHLAAHDQELLEQAAQMEQIRQKQAQIDAVFADMQSVLSEHGVRLHDLEEWRHWTKET